ncbi:hypothetical protein [Brevibacillus migulae]|uniref:hypothetical protein n=1 Tax=Brevibacillus migulae TaxID=1644114 RepID=UPI00106EF9BC|nr:hypothetical protein [Brevibacillus migulae]
MKTYEDYLYEYIDIPRLEDRMKDLEDWISKGGTVYEMDRMISEYNTLRLIQSQAVNAQQKRY